MLHVQEQVGTLDILGRQILPIQDNYPWSNKSQEHIEMNKDTIYPLHKSYDDSVRADSQSNIGHLRHYITVFTALPYIAIMTKS